MFLLKEEKITILFQNENKDHKKNLYSFLGPFLRAYMKNLFLIGHE